MSESANEFITRKEKQFQKDLKAKKLIGMTDIGRQASHGYLREAWTFMQQSNLPNKVFIIERLRYAKLKGKAIHTDNQVGDIEYRVGYYIVGQFGRAKDKWVWGQFCPLIPKKDFNKLIKKARGEETII